MKNISDYEKFGLNESEDYNELVQKISLPAQVLAKDKFPTLTDMAEENAKRLDYEGDLVRYVCYKMLVECNDHELAKEFVRLCNEIK